MIEQTSQFLQILYLFHNVNIRHLLFTHF